jgi:CcmD family protein
MQTTTDDSGFHAAPTGGETQSGSHLLIEAYAAIWLCVLVFVLVLFRKTRDMEARVEVLRDAIRAAPKKTASTPPSATKKKVAAEPRSIGESTSESGES